MWHNCTTEEPGCALEDIQEQQVKAVAEQIGEDQSTQDPLSYSPPIPPAQGSVTRRATTLF